MEFPISGKKVDFYNSFKKIAPFFRILQGRQERHTLFCIFKKKTKYYYDSEFFPSQSPVPSAKAINS